MLPRRSLVLSRCFGFLLVLGLWLALPVQGQLTATYNATSDVPVTAAGYTATGAVTLTLNFAPAVGTTLKVVENTGLNFISGTFSNLAQGQSVTLTYNSKSYDFVADYFGGTGNDLVLVWKKTRLIGWGAGGKQLGFDPERAQGATIAGAVDTPAGQLNGRSVLQVTSGGSYTIALCSDGTLLAWGEGFTGCLGTGTTTAAPLPTPVNQATGPLASRRVVHISGGDQHVLALCSDGSVVAWGNNANGRLGDNSTTQRNNPVLINTGDIAGKSVVAISAGGSHSLALCSDGTLLAWGLNANGQLGTGDRTQRLIPTAVTTTGTLIAGKTFVSIGAGGDTTNVLCSDGTVFGWGNNRYGQIGASDYPDTLSPVATLTGAGSALQGKLVKSISVGSTQSTAICTDGTLVAWGIFGGDGQDASTRNYIPVPVSTAGVLSGKTAASTYSRTNHNTVLCTDGTLVAWGENSQASCGDGTLTTRTLPVLTNTSNLAPDDRIVRLSHGPLSFNNFAIVAYSGLPDIALEQPAGNNLTSGASTTAFGTEELSFSKPLGYTLRNVGSGPLNVTSIGLGGANPGDFSVSGLTLPLTLPPHGTVNFVVSFTPTVAAARSATLQIGSTDADENPFTLNLTGTGQVLDTTPVNASYTTGQEVPVTAAGYTAAGRMLNLTFNFQPTVGMKLTVINNTALTFIKGTFTNLAQGQVVVVPFGGKNYLYVANYYGGTGNDLELVWAANRLVTWGSGGPGLGVSPPTDSAIQIPTSVGESGGLLEGRTILRVASSGYYTVALCSDGKLLSWGYDFGHLLGIGLADGNPRPLPVEVDQTGVLAGKQVVAIAAGEGHTLALTSDGKVVAWGTNNVGQVGDGTTTDRNAPVLVNTDGALAGKFVVAISAGYNHSLALCTDGTLVAWGGNNVGTLGNGGTIDSALPVTVTTVGTPLASRTVSSISCGSSFSLALCTDGTVAAWGNNGYGELGIGAGTNPVLIPTAVNVGAGSALQGKTVKSISAGAAEATALCTDGTFVAWGLFTGDGTDNSRQSPVLVSTSTDLSGKTVIAHSAFANFKTALCSDGSLVGWGYNGEGGVGDNSLTERLFPVGVNSSVLIANEKFSSLAVGNRSTRAFAIVSTPGEPEIAVEYPLGTELTDGAASVDFGDSRVGVGLTESLTIRNTSTVTLNVTAINLSGAQLADYSISGITFPLALGPNRSKSFNVTLTPSGTGTRNASLQIVNTDGNENPYDIALTGTGSVTPTTPISATYTTGLEVPVTAERFFANNRLVNFTLDHSPLVGRDLMVVNNTGTRPIFGNFIGLPQGQEVVLPYNGAYYTYVIDYFGGTGNDVVLVWAANRLFSWGVGPKQLGQTDSPSQNNIGKPEPVFGSGVLAGKTILRVASSYHNTMAVCADGTLAGWGLNNEGELDPGHDGNKYIPFAMPVTGALVGRRVVDVAIGIEHVLALCSDGALVAWGTNSTGQLGTGGAMNYNLSPPVLVNTNGVLAGKKVVKIAVSVYSNYALCSDGTIAAWGDNSKGQLGDGTTTNRGLPVEVIRFGTPLMGKTITDIVVGQYYATALCSDGTLGAWGWKPYLGSGGGGDSVLSPSAVDTGAGSALQGRTPVSISAGDIGPMVLCNDGALVAWGYWPGNASSDRVSIPTLVKTTAPSALLGKTAAKQFTTAANHYALNTDGSFIAWGYNGDGAVGDNTFSDQTQAVFVNTSSLGSGEKVVTMAKGPDSGSAFAIVAGTQVVEIAVEQPANNDLTDGSSTVAFGSVLVDTPVTKTFVIKSTGNYNLSGLTISIDGTDAADFQITTPPSTPVVAGGSTTFVLEYHATTLGGKTAALHISSTDYDENSFDIALTATSIGIPEIDVQEVVDTSIPSGSTVAFGNAITGTAKVKTFTIVNKGTDTLANLALQFSASDFSADAPLGALSLAPGASTTFRVKFQPGSAGGATGTLDIASNDGNENPYRLNFTGNGVLTSPQEIQLFSNDDDNAELTDNTGSVAFGNTELGLSKTYTFTIRNSGTANLNGLALSKTGTNAADFTLGALSTTSLGFEATTEFTVTFLPGALGARTATVRVASNDGNENPFDIILTGTGTTPEISIEVLGGALVADGGSISLGTTVPVGTGVDRTLVIKNLGTATLYLSSIVVDGVNASDFTLLGIGDVAIGPGGSTTQPFTFRPSSFGPRVAAIHFVNNDANESPYDINFTATAVGPEISVEQPAATVLTDNVGAINFGPAIQPTFTTRTFTIKNPGTATLSSIAASFVGDDAANFTITTAPPTSLAAKGTTTFIARFTPNAVRVFNATLRIASTDYDENPFDIAVTGEGVTTLKPSFDVHPQSQIIALGQPVTFSATVDSPTAFTSQWRKGTATFANIAGATTTSYSIAAVKLTDAAVLYRLRATNAADFADSDTAALTVVDRIAKTFNLAANTPKVTFSVSAATTPGTTLTYHWLKDGGELPVDARYVPNGNTLVINTLNTDDSGTFTCEVTGPGGMMTSGDNVLTVFDSAPVISPSTVVMDDGIVSGDYSFFIPLDPTKGTATSFTASPLPPGLKFNTATGEFTGKPTTAKNYTLTVTAKNSINPTSTATATLLVKPLTAGADGDYLGIIDRGPVNDNLGGRFELKVTLTGSYSGKLFLGAKNYPLPPGSVTTTAGSSLVTGSITIARAPQPAIAVTFTINTLTNRITIGAVSSAGLGSASFTGWKNTWTSGPQATDYDDYFTFSLDAPLLLAGNPDIPQGLGFGSFKVPSKGESFAIAGRTADGDSFTSSSFLGPDGDIAIYDDLASKGSIVGILDIVLGTGPSLGKSTLAGSPTWSRPADPAPKATTYKDGFAPFSLIVTGGTYFAPASNAIVLSKPTPAAANNAGIAFFDAGMDGPPSRADRRVSLIPGTTVTIAAAGITQTTLKITSATGVFSGGFTLVDAHPVTPGAKAITRKPTFQGIIVPTATGLKGHGFFLLPQLPEPIFPQPPALPTLSGGVILE